MNDKPYDTPAKRLRVDIAEGVIYTDMFARGYNYPASMKEDILSVLDELDRLRLNLEVQEVINETHRGISANHWREVDMLEMRILRTTRMNLWQRLKWALFQLEGK